MEEIFIYLGWIIQIWIWAFRNLDLILCVSSIACLFIGGLSAGMVILCILIAIGGAAVRVWRIRKKRS